MTRKKVSIFEKIFNDGYNNQYGYHDEFGFGWFSIENFSIFEGNNEYKFGEIYKQKDLPLNSAYDLRYYLYNVRDFSNSVDNLKTLFNTELYVIENNDVRKLVPSKYRISVGFKEVCHSNCIYKKIVDINSFDELESYKFYISDINEEFTNPCFVDLKVGRKYYYKGKGTCILTKIYIDATKDSFICDLKDLKGDIINVNFGDSNLCYLPYEELFSDREFLKKGLNEFFLQTYVYFHEHTYNVYWLEINDAARYIVSVYKTIESKVSIKTIYHLEDYEVDRNTKFLVLDNLVGGKFIFRVTAEDRDGKIISQSRGITLEMDGKF